MKKRAKEAENKRDGRGRGPSHNERCGESERENLKKKEERNKPIRVEQKKNKKASERRK